MIRVKEMMIGTRYLCRITQLYKRLRVFLVNKLSYLEKVLVLLLIDLKHMYMFLKVDQHHVEQLRQEQGQLKRELFLTPNKMS